MAKNQRLVIQAGSCIMNGGDGRICALQSLDCPAGTSFTSPQMLQQGGGGLAHGGTCATRQGTEEVAKIGSCLNVDDNGFCASDASSCADSQSFVAVDDRCTIRTDGVTKEQNFDASVTKFGKCMADNTCYWSQQDCSNPALWRKPHTDGASNSSSDCTCEEVRVGACQDDQGFYYCAVSARACSTADQWIDAPSLLMSNAADAPDCFLCRQDEVTPIQQGAPTPTMSPTTDPIQNNLARMGQTSSQDSSSKTAAIIGASVGGAVLLLLFVGVIATVFGGGRKQKKAPHQQQREATGDNKEVSDVPLETIDNSSGHHHYGVEDDIEDLSDDGL